MKKVLLILPLAFLLAACNKKSYSYNELDFHKRLDNTYEVSLKLDSKAKKINIPSKYDNTLVTRITGFTGNSYINSVNIPKSVVEIEDNAFNFCENLENIIVSTDNSVYSSLNGNLYSKNKETLIKYVSDRAKNDISVSNISTISSYSFCNLENMETLTIDATTLENSSIYYCSNLKYIYLDSSNITFNGNPFNSNTNLKYVYLLEDASLNDLNNVLEKTSKKVFKDKKYIAYEVK